MSRQMTQQSGTSFRWHRSLSGTLQIIRAFDILLAMY
jgi:hypothetical protein